jgi:hypothetical protein
MIDENQAQSGFFVFLPPLPDAIKSAGNGELETVIIETVSHAPSH